MAREQGKDLSIKPVTTPRQVQEASSRLATMPFAALLPRLGDIRDVVNFSEEFAERAAELQSRNFSSNGLEDEDAELRKRRTLEESMLNQALQWLSIQSSRE